MIRVMIINLLSRKNKTLSEQTAIFTVVALDACDRVRIPNDLLQAGCSFQGVQSLLLVEKRQDARFLYGSLRTDSLLRLQPYML